MEQIPLEDLALLEVLKKISDGDEPSPARSEVEQRLITGGLVEEGSEMLNLTAAGVAMCKSLQHRVAADSLVAKARDQATDDPQAGSKTA